MRRHGALVGGDPQWNGQDGMRATGNREQFAMTGFWYRLKRSARGLALAAVLVVAGGSAAFLAARVPQAAGPRPASQPNADTTEKSLWAGRDTVIVPENVARNLGLQTALIPSRARPIRLPTLQGVLAVDSEHLSRIRTRFAGEVVSIGPDFETTAASVTSYMPLPRPRVGDAVRKGDLLAVVLSKDLGEKKSELVDSLEAPGRRSGLATLRDGQAEGSIRRDPCGMPAHGGVRQDRGSARRSDAANLAADRG